MTDILIELRRIQKMMETGKSYGFEQSVWKDAADEIHKLRAALKRVGDDYPGSSCQQWCYEQAGIDATTTF